MDVRALEYDLDEFDCVIDKGLLDTVLCGLHSTANVHKMLTNVWEVMKPGGVYYCISHGIPEERMEFLDLSWSDSMDWKVTVT